MNPLLNTKLAEFKASITDSYEANAKLIQTLKDRDSALFDEIRDYTLLMLAEATLHTGIDYNLSTSKSFDARDMTSEMTVTFQSMDYKLSNGANVGKFEVTLSENSFMYNGLAAESRQLATILDLINERTQEYFAPRRNVVE